MWRAMDVDEKPDYIIDKPFALKCPRCGVQSNLTAVSFPRFAQAKRYELNEVIIGFRCDACNKSVAARFEARIDVQKLHPQKPATYHLSLSDDLAEIERHMETFEYEHLPGEVAADLKEVLVSYSCGCPNAAAAMCRRTLQSVATDLGATGSDKVQKQLLEAKETAGLDDDIYAALKEIMLGGHDAAHPHLPDVTPERAALLVEILRDVLTQIYVRRARIRESMNLRKQAIDARKN